MQSWRLKHLKGFNFILVMLTISYGPYMSQKNWYADGLPAYKMVTSWFQVCSLPSVTGRCRAAFHRYYFNSSTMQCQQFIYGGCEGNANNFKTLAHCQSACTCNLLMDRGVSSSDGQSCQQSLQSYYDVNEAKCKRFSYLGCDGNGNRFESKSDCRTACAAIRCFGPRQNSVCDGRRKQRFFYNTASGECERFWYRGCNEDNENRFHARRNCQRLCVP